ncbi:MAG: hypothetical protein A2189_04590 [Paenibacillus sp. RIFOXYA1_FULL_44_5]|nr:MAG: hypothetical protein A2189_04590 [Paenibacillus sp. RIFOXYA1_FULL_44_5]
MVQNAYVKFVSGSTVTSMSLNEVKEQLVKYQEQTSLTGKQLDWDYKDSAFPYSIEDKPEAEGKWFYMKAQDPKYKHIVFGIGKEQIDEQETHYIQVALPEGSTYGDKGKANEFCKYLARQLKAELHLFNGRIMYFNPRK